jgi:hypothetical protein
VQTQSHGETEFVSYRARGHPPSLEPVAAKRNVHKSLTVRLLWRSLMTPQPRWVRTEAKCCMQICTRRQSVDPAVVRKTSLTVRLVLLMGLLSRTVRLSSQKPSSMTPQPRKEKAAAAVKLPGLRISP